MSVLWSGFLEGFQLSLFWLTHFYGGHLAPAIISFSLLARLLLLPLTLPLALRGRRHARELRFLQPELARVRQRWLKEDSQRLVLETMAVYERHGVQPLGSGMLGGSLLQAPVLVGLFGAVRKSLSTLAVPQGFLWVKDLARPDLAMGVVASLLVGLGSLALSHPNQPKWALALPVVATFIMGMTLSSGFALYLGSSGMVASLQGLLLRRADP